MQVFEKLEYIRKKVGKRHTQGLPDSVLKNFKDADPTLNAAIDLGFMAFQEIEKTYSDFLKLDEKVLIEKVQNGILNFYPNDQRNPYVAMAAKGPWLVTAYGAILHDSGGYGMLGFGHAPDPILKAMMPPYVMANVMTPNFSQKKFYDLIQREIGHTREDQPYPKIICVNSGSEANTVATRISDLHAKKMTDPQGPHGGKQIKFLSMKGSFHGRTERPAQASHSSHKNYQALATFRDYNPTITVEPNNMQELQNIFDWSDREGVFFECVFIEPVMGEGNPGLAITREFYDLVRELTKKHQSLLLVDSVQAGLRAQGCLSICDYPGFQDCSPPDMETFSKALNAGQFPLSVVAMTNTTADIYAKGVYGNTMTTNPRALEVGSAVLSLVSPQLRSNIVERGTELLEKLNKLKEEFPEDVVSVQGTGLLCSIELNPDRLKVVGFGELEEYLRLRGIGVIHGGANALRLTPHFFITSREIDLIIYYIRDALQNGPRVK